MRVARLQFSLRLMMTVVAVTGLSLGTGLWGFRMWRLSLHYAGLAQSYKTLEKAYRNVSASSIWAVQLLERGLQLPALEAIGAKQFHQLGERNGQLGAGTRWIAAKLAALADGCAAQAIKYDRAARCPWVSVAPDILPGAPSPSTKPHDAPLRPIDGTSTKTQWASPAPPAGGSR
jgi:hypothetical protein